MFRDDLAPALAAAVLLVAVAPTLAQEAGDREEPAATLEVGDPAPPLSIEKWVKGETIAAFAAGHPYVVEFWATWCRPCVASMPHLSALQKKYAGRATVIGVTSADDHGNTLEAVEAMVAKKGDTMGYTVAWDTGHETADAYRKASGRYGIPCAFLVDGTGKIAWIGHPMWLDEPLDLVVQHEWDIAAGNARMAKIEQTYRGIYEHLSDDPKRSLELIETFEKDFPAYAHIVEDVKFDALLSAGRYDDAYVYGKQMVSKAVAEKDAVALNAIAWKIVDPQGKLDKRDLDLAQTAAEEACKLTGYRDGAILDTLARVYFWRGDLEKALELQKKAVSSADGRLKEILEEVLREYQKAQLD